ncbi:MAG: hypothetical protein IJK29_06135 [Bacteroidales bacterium]|nr:hypothetical protein [Bacteroidales bacterium]
MPFADFILQHEADDPVRLLLSRDKYPDIDIDLAVTTLEVRRKLRTKVPEWYAVPSLIYPFRLSGEQCSSSETARYKAKVVRCHSERSEGIWNVADLTGGMGVDAWAFAQVAGEVLYNEMQVELARATELNFRELGVGNVRFRNCLVEPGKLKEVLDGFRPDVIFLDPARRAEDGRKVFLIEECQPDVLGLLPELFEAARYVLLKLSPMADITMACKRLGTHVKEVHVVAAGGECKELLFLLDRDWVGTPSTFIVEGGAVMEIPDGPSTTSTGSATGSGTVGPLVISTGAKRSGEIWLFEPGKALLKAGAFGLPCERFGLTKLGQHTHLYAGEAVPEELRPFGKVFEILEVMPLNNRTMKEAGKRWPQAEVTARNVPMTSDLLRKKLGCASGGDVHLFGGRVEAAAEAGNYLIVTQKRYGTD